MINEIIRNKEVLLRAAKSANWKTSRATQCVDRRFGGKQLPYDKRNIFNLAALSIKMDNIPDAEREAYFDSEVEKIIDAFEGLTDIKPYMEKLYSMVAVDENIDWSDEAQVENMFISLQTNQAISTMAPDFPKETIELYQTHEEIKRIDGLICKSDMLYFKVGELLMQTDFYDQINKLIPIGLIKGGFYGTPTTKMEIEVTERVLNETANRNGTILLDAAINDHAKKFFFGKPVEMYNPYDNTLYNEDQYAKDYLSALEFAARHSSIEQLTIKTLNKGDEDCEFDYHSLLRINGKSLSELRQDLKREKNLYGENAEFALGKMLRNALTDGKSLVTMTRLTPSADGRMRIEHKELKVDLDRLNEIDRKENHYNFFRRWLDKIGWWKIQRFPTNARRDANQEKLKNDPKYQSSMRALEDKVEEIYNGINPKDVGAKSLVTAIPKITREEAIPAQQLGEQVASNEGQREQVVGIELENEKKIPLEPVKESDDKVLTNEIKTK